MRLHAGHNFEFIPWITLVAAGTTPHTARRQRDVICVLRCINAGARRREKKNARPHSLVHHQIFIFASTAAPAKVSSQSLESMKHIWVSWWNVYIYTAGQCYRRRKIDQSEKSKSAWVNFIIYSALGRRFALKCGTSRSVYMEPVGFLPHQFAACICIAPTWKVLEALVSLDGSEWRPSLEKLDLKHILI